jgi:hypothetical protein
VAIPPSKHCVPPLQPHPALHSPVVTSWDLSCLTNSYFTMYKLTWILFTFFSLILPVLSAPVPAPEEFENLEKRTTHTGRARIFPSSRVHDADLSAHREPGTNLASVTVVGPIPPMTSSSLCQRASTIKMMGAIAGRCANFLVRCIHPV